MDKPSEPTPGRIYRIGKLTPFGLSAPAVILLAGFLTTPLVLLGRVSLYEAGTGYGFFTAGTWTTANYSNILDGFGIWLIGFTIAFALGIAGITIPVAYFLALFIRGLSLSWQRITLTIVLLPKLIGVLPILFGIQQLLGDAGPVNHLLLKLGLIAEPIRIIRGIPGALIGEVYLILPYAVMLLVVQLGTIDPVLAQAAKGLGASPWSTFIRITLPLSAPGLALATQLSLVWGMGALLGPLILGGPEQVTLSVEIHRQAFEYGRWPRAAALAVLLTASVGICSALSVLLFGLFRRRSAP